MLAKMKDSLYIDNGLSIYFYAKVMDIANYLYNKLPTKHNGPTFILKKA